MLLELTLKCHLSDYQHTVGTPKEDRWLKEKMRLRLVLGKSGLEGFPISIEKIEYVDDHMCIIFVYLINDSNYMDNDFFTEGTELYLAVGIHIVGRCQLEANG